jgi:Na+/H+ antiporter NhaD/arsenite permease-like protein
MAQARRSSRGKRRGRAVFALGLIVFMTVTGVVIWRRSVGIAVSKQSNAMESELRMIKSQRDLLEQQMREALERRRVVSDAERRLGLHVATDAQTRTIADSAVVP